MIDLYAFQRATLIRKDSIDSWGEAGTGVETPMQVLFKQKLETMNDSRGKQEISKGFFYSKQMPLYTDKLRVANSSAPTKTNTAALNYPSGSILDDSLAATLSACDLTKWYSPSYPFWSEMGNSAQYANNAFAALKRRLDSLRVTKVSFTSDVPLKFRIAIGTFDENFDPIQQVLKTDIVATTEHVFKLPSVAANMLLIVIPEGDYSVFEISSVSITHETPTDFGYTEYRICMVDSLQGFENYGYKTYVA